MSSALVEALKVLVATQVEFIVVGTATGMPVLEERSRTRESNEPARRAAVSESLPRCASRVGTSR
jgi:hypothetical protein